MGHGSIKIKSFLKNTKLSIILVKMNLSYTLTLRKIKNLIYSNRKYFKTPESSMQRVKLDFFLI